MNNRTYYDDVKVLGNEKVICEQSKVELFIGNLVENTCFALLDSE